jgi:rhamnogalacturonyl hydrolase YesR
MYIKIIEYMPEKAEMKQFYISDLQTFISNITAYYEAKGLFFSGANIGNEKGEYIFSTKVGSSLDFTAVVKYAE